jgi:hypothetical protein
MVAPATRYIQHVPIVDGELQNNAELPSTGRLACSQAASEHVDGCISMRARNVLYSA